MLVLRQVEGTLLQLSHPPGFLDSQTGVTTLATRIAVREACVNPGQAELHAGAQLLQERQCWDTQ